MSVPQRRFWERNARLLHLRHVEKKTFRQIAALTGLTLGKVANVMRRYGGQPRQKTEPGERCFSLVVWWAPKLPYWRCATTDTHEALDANEALYLSRLYERKRGVFCTEIRRMI